ncbi:hypothetical protein [Paenibacillus bovis]|uniref:Uncharacterized protein n=1 Tax=Paenibacillus bovis TaxID=1616788 RepID=A0A1X9T3X7_9BACL|nr:hypothetical protein [Paenibacillus bovis]ARR10631.1 hypothetical protein AR543_p0023 [Paenibacillus bovis]
MNQRQKLIIAQFKFMALQNWIYILYHEKKEISYSVRDLMEGPFQYVVDFWSKHHQAIPIHMLNTNCEKALEELANDGIIERVGSSKFSLDADKSDNAFSYSSLISQQLNELIDMKWIDNETGQVVKIDKFTPKEIADKLAEKKLEYEACFKNTINLAPLFMGHYVYDWFALYQ